VVIVLSTVTLAFDDPISDPDSDFNTFLRWCDIVFTICFGIEFFLKVVTFGLLFNGSLSYLRDNWNIMDFIILLLSILSLTKVQDLKFMKAIRLVRVLRPLRVISKNKGLKISVLCLVNSALDILRVFVLSMALFGVFAVFA